jgi:hypothetical protein
MRYTLSMLIGRHLLNLAEHDIVTNLMRVLS